MLEVSDYISVSCTYAYIPKHVFIYVSDPERSHTSFHQ